jgi:hypothetical protein
MGGIEPPLKVLQTRASPLGHMTRSGGNNTEYLLVYKMSRLHDYIRFSDNYRVFNIAVKIGAEFRKFAN